MGYGEYYDASRGDFSTEKGVFVQNRLSRKIGRDSVITLSGKWRNDAGFQDRPNLGCTT